MDTTLLKILGPWYPFAFSLFGRAVMALLILSSIDGSVLGLIPRPVRSFAFCGAAFFIGVTVVQAVAAHINAGPTPDMDVSVQTGTFRSESVAWAACSMRGWREAMEDAHVIDMLDPSVFDDAALFAVLDGHGGKEVSTLASRLLTGEVLLRGRELRVADKETVGSGLLEATLAEALPRLDAKLRAGPHWIGRAMPGVLHPFTACGSTACVAAVNFDSREVIAANVGDSRALLIRNGKAIPLTKDHKPEDPIERSRIKDAGGRVIRMGPCYRVDGNLNLSRALGDFNLKANASLPPNKQKVTAFPDCTRTSFVGGPQELLVVACDGIFERCSCQDVADIIWPRLKSGMVLEQIGKELLHACCAMSVKGQPSGYGTDNETVILVKLPGENTAGGDWSPGQRVAIHGLHSDGGQRLNGQVGVVEGPASDKSSGSSNSGETRYEVRLDSGEVKSFKASNLQIHESVSSI